MDSPMSELFLFVRPPRPLWPFNGPASAFWPPLAFASLAAALREAIPDLRVAILDAPALHMGWRSLEVEIRRLRPSYIGIGEEAVSCAEGLRLARLTKELGAQVIAGGCLFGHVAPEVLRTGLVDIVVHGEGEVTVVELVETLRSGAPRGLRHVLGISFADGEEIIRTPPRPLLPDLDLLPFPAYDLLPVGRYGRGSRSHPNLAAIELGRGCLGSCAFCVLWRQMGRVQGSRVVPQLRSKSPERLLEEIRFLVERHDRRYLGWVDPCFNADPEIPGKLADLLLRNGIRLGQSAWVRADGLVRDHESGALGKIVRAGLNEVYIGIERPDGAGLRALEKRADPTDAAAALRILAREYPDVFTIGSLIYGLPGDTPETMRTIWQFSVDLDLDTVFYIPLTPLPGTPYWRPDLWDPTGSRFRRFGFLPTWDSGDVIAPLTRRLLFLGLFDWSRPRLRSVLQRLSSPNARIRRMNRRLLARDLRLVAGLTLETVLGARAQGGMRVPSWYES
jgi:anaerobic magnesium-protoporphyrin IX monomethyl ester cyclase